MEDAAMSEKNLKFNSRHANGNNPNKKAFWGKREYKKRPDNWKEIYPPLKKNTSSRKRLEKRILDEIGEPDYSLAWCKGDD